MMTTEPTANQKPRSWKPEDVQDEPVERLPPDPGRVQPPVMPHSPPPSAEAPPRRQRRLRDDPLEARSGHYIMSYGLTGAGKTALQSFLTYYLTHMGPFTTTPVFLPDQSTQAWEPQALINHWTEAWRKGRFPSRNSAAEDDIRELRLRIVPKEGVRTPLEFGFLEAGGELMRKVVVEPGHDPEMVHTLRAYFSNPNVDLILMLLVDPDQPLLSDVLFDNLLTHLDINFPGLRERISLGILISKPETALRQLKEENPGMAHYPALRGDLCEDYLQAFAPRTFRLLEDWPNQSRVGIMSLHLGELVALDSAAEQSPLFDPVKAVARVDTQDISRITAWIYQQFTGQSLGPTRWQRWLRWLRS